MSINKHREAAVKFGKKIIVKILKTIKMTQVKGTTKEVLDKLLSNVVLRQNEKRCCIMCQNEDRNKY
jgi:citrate lyase gamma subunit